MAMVPKTLITAAGVDAKIAAARGLITTEIEDATAPIRAYKPGLWFNQPDTLYSTAAAQAANMLYVSRFAFQGDFNCTDVGVGVNVGVASQTALLGIYEYDPTTDRAAVLLRQGIGAVSLATSVVFVSTPLTAPLVLQKNRQYFQGVLMSGAATLYSMSQNFTGSDNGATVGRVGTAAVVGLRTAQTYASGLPANLAGASWTEVITAICPVMQFKHAA